MKLQRLLSLIRQAVDQYEMIEEGDHIAIGISGGKDSLTLLWGLAHLQKFYPKHFSLSAITVDMGIDTMNLEPIKALCQEIQFLMRSYRRKSGKFSLISGKKPIPVLSAPNFGKAHSIRKPWKWDVIRLPTPITRMI